MKFRGAVILLLGLALGEAALRAESPCGTLLIDDLCPPPCKPASLRPCAAPCPSPCPPRPKTQHTSLEFDADFLLWWTRSLDVPALENFDVRPGARFAGRFLYDQGGLEVGGFWLANGSASPASAPIHATSRLWGMHAAGVYRLGACDDADWGLDLLVGYQFLQLAESLSADRPVAGLDPDTFTTRNTFHGGKVGLHGWLPLADFSLQATASLALGSIDQGKTDSFGVLPQAGVSLGYQITSHVALAAGYDFLYLDGVTRPGHADTTGFWTHGSKFSVEIGY